MKKFLLSLAVLASASFAAQAQELMNFNECMALTYKGVELVADGEINVTDFTDVADLYGEGAVSYSADVEMENLDIMDSYVNAVLAYKVPTKKQYEEDPFFWGEPQLCYTAPYGSNCLAGGNGITTICNATLKVPASGMGTFIYQLHLNAAQKTAVSRYAVTLTVMDSDADGAKAISTPFTFYVNYKSEDSGVDEIGVADDAEGVYYDLQGRRVENPEKGIYIYKANGKTVKRVIR